MKILGQVVVVLVLLVGVAVTQGQSGGQKKGAAKPYEYGNVVIDKFSTANKIAPVLFKHWTHRSKYTCRLCHVDLGFAMEAGATGIKQEDNVAGLYCGACHNGKEAFPSSQVSGRPVQHCNRCHVDAPDKDVEKRFDEFARSLPRARFGNKIDWTKAEEQGLVKPKSQIEGMAAKGKDLAKVNDEQIKSGAEGMPDILFSHKKHTVWNGCQLCHPDIFGVKKGSNVYEMQDIFNGKYCGACHGKVAFPNSDCSLCHTKEVS